MRHHRRGFTLIELLVVVAIIGILSAIGIVSYGKYKTSAEKKQAEISLSSIYLAEQEYKSNNGSYYYNSSLNNIINEHIMTRLRTIWGLNLKEIKEN